MSPELNDKKNKKTEQIKKQYESNPPGSRKLTDHSM